MDRDTLIRQLGLKLNSPADTVERLFCASVLAEGTDVSARVFARFNDWKRTLLSKATTDTAALEETIQGIINEELRKKKPSRLVLCRRIMSALASEAHNKLQTAIALLERYNKLASGAVSKDDRLLDDVKMFLGGIARQPHA